MPVIATKDLTKSYGKARGIVEVSLTVEAGEVYGFIGPNGAGKSTTIRTLLDFLHPTSGTAEILGMDTVTRSADIKRRLGYVPAEVNYYDDMKVGALLDYSIRFYGKPDKNRIRELGEWFDLDMSRKIEDLSTGNKKKVAIVQALLHRPELLILDEPTNGLDPLMQNQLFDLLAEEKKRTTIFFSSHILSEVQRICDRVAIIKEGRILRVEEIAHLKSRTHKHIRAIGPGMEGWKGFDLSGASEIEIKGEHLSFWYTGPLQELMRKMAGYPMENVWIEDPSLEEIFLHDYRKEG
ncbi:MAG TPA: ABC transporter ATP-binding protein [Spirochaetia bacterium]|nr:ABC transporter ATP-binding protein [Spirochaetia bacterium]